MPHVHCTEPRPPITTLRLFHNHRPGHDWPASRRAFDALPVEDQEYWEEKAALDRKRYEQQKREYNATLDLDEDILTDQEAIDECECGNGVNDIRLATQKQRCEQQWARYRQDHATFKQGYKAPAQATGSGQFCRFMDLPKEIQGQIYGRLFETSPRTRELRQWQLEFEATDCGAELRFTHTQPLDTRILAVSRGVYYAALGTLYSTNYFVVDVSRASTLPLFVRDPTHLSAPRPTSRIKRWHIRLIYTDRADTQTTKRQLIAVRDTMKQCTRLDEVRFTWITVPAYWAELSILTKEYETMLSLFNEVRGVRKVIFTEPSESLENKGWLDGWDDIHLANKEARESVKASMESQA
ncbi:MAG: hypothetical protein LQ344_002893 [Seirophora lacunosa]|nr:MAG: hypothetical protein LQ344_002893 [Seirophora lacunosa]